MASIPLMGPDAPDDDNWSEVIQHHPHAVADQSIGLPELGSYHLYPIYPPLPKEATLENFEEWHQVIMKSLQDFGMQNLVEKEVQRPKRNAQNAEKWWQMSTHTQTWITRCVDQKLATDILRRHPETRLADKFMDELRKEFRREGQEAINHAMWTLMGLRRADFRTSKDFILAVQHWNQQCNEQDCRIVPYHMMAKVILELESMPHLEQCLRVKKSNLYAKKDVINTVTDSDFHALCAEIIDEIKDLGDEILEPGEMAGPWSAGGLPIANLASSGPALSTGAEVKLEIDDLAQTPVDTTVSSGNDSPFVSAGSKLTESLLSSIPVDPKLIPNIFGASSSANNTLGSLTPEPKFSCDGSPASNLLGSSTPSANTSRPHTAAGDSLNSSTTSTIVGRRGASSLCLSTTDLSPPIVSRVASPIDGTPGDSSVLSPTFSLTGRTPYVVPNIDPSTGYFSVTATSSLTAVATVEPGDNPSVSFSNAANVPAPVRPSIENVSGSTVPNINTFRERARLSGSFSRHSTTDPSDTPIVSRTVTPISALGGGPSFFPAETDSGTANDSGAQARTGYFRNLSPFDTPNGTEAPISLALRVVTGSGIVDSRCSVCGHGRGQHRASCPDLRSLEGESGADWSHPSDTLSGDMSGTTFVESP